MTSIGEILQSKVNGGILPVSAIEPDRQQERPQTNVAELLKNGGVAVVVGGRSSNFDYKMREHAQLIFWDSTDPKARTKPLPSNARVVLMLPRFLGHSDTNRISKEAKGRGIPALMMTSTGDVKDMLQPVVDRPIAPTLKADVEPPRYELIRPADATPKPTSDTTAVAHLVNETTNKVVGVATGALRRVIPGELRRLALEHGNLDAPRMKEAERLLAILERENKATSTVASVAFTLNKIMHERATPPALTPVVAPAAAAQDEFRQPTPLATTRAIVAASTDSQRDALLEAIDEAERHIGDMKAAADLLGELMPKIRAEIAKFRDRQKKARDMVREFLD